MSGVKITGGSATGGDGGGGRGGDAKAGDVSYTDQSTSEEGGKGPPYALYVALALAAIVAVMAAVTSGYVSVEYSDDGIKVTPAEQREDANGQEADIGPVP